MQLQSQRPNSRSQGGGPISARYKQATGTAEARIEDLVRIAKDYRIDVVACPGHLGHKEPRALYGIDRETCRDWMASVTRAADSEGGHGRSLPVVGASPHLSSDVKRTDGQKRAPVVA